MPGIDPLRAIIAIVLSLVLWVVIRTEQNPEREDTTSFTVPVEVIDAPPGLQVTSDPPEVRIFLRAPERSWDQLGPQSFRAVAEAGAAVEGLNELQVRVEKLNLEVRGDPVAVPATVPVRLEALEEKIVPVRVEIAGGVPFGYTYAPPIAQPANVTVGGPASLVRGVVAAVVDLRLDGVTVSVNSTNAVRPVDVRSQDVRNVQLNPSAVNVTVQVSQQVTYKQVGVRPVTSGVPAPGYVVESVSVDPASVTLVGNPTSLSSIEFVDTRGVSVTDATSAVVETTELEVPGGVSLLQQSPVTVTVRVSPLTLTQTVRVPVSVSGLRGGILMQSELPAVDVTVSGPAPTLQDLNPTDFQVQVDLSGLGPGKHQVRPLVIVPEALSVVRYSPEQLTVTLAQPTPTPTATPTPTLEPTATSSPTSTPTETPTVQVAPPVEPPPDTPTPAASVTLPLEGQAIPSDI